jgi:hypothetical protein
MSGLKPRPTRLAVRRSRRRQCGGGRAVAFVSASFGLAILVEDAGDGFAPAHCVAEAGVGADSLDISRSGELYVVAALEDVFDGEEIIAAAPLEEARGVSVTVKNASVLELEVAGDSARTVPVEEFFLDGFAFGMMADGTFAAMAFE